MNAQGRPIRSFSHAAQLELGRCQSRLYLLHMLLVNTAKLQLSNHILLYTHPDYVTRNFLPLRTTNTPW